MRKPIYLDYNGTTPHDPEVVEAMLPYLKKEFGNPSSSHWYGKGPREAVVRSRKQVASVLDCDPSEVLFTSGGTESNNQALKSIGGSRFKEGNHIITSAIEHPAILEVCRYLENHGFSITLVPVDAHGIVDPSDVEGAIRDDTVMISVMHANNEVGTIQPITEIAGIARREGILMHTDAAQSVGKIATSVEEMDVDLLSVAGHKLYAPKGIGALYIRKGIKPVIFCHGAGQESGRRAGTENVLEIVGLGKACERAGVGIQQYGDHMQKMRDRLEDGLSSAIVDVRVNGHRKKRLPNTSSISFLGVDANRLLSEIDSEVAASAGAACHADHVEISHVLQAMSVPKEWARGTVRFSTGRFTTEDEIDHALESIVAAVNRLRG